MSDDKKMELVTAAEILAIVQPWGGTGLVEASERVAALMAERWLASLPHASPSEIALLLWERRKTLQAEDHWAKVQALVEAVQECPEIDSDEDAHDEECARVGDDDAACTCRVGRLRIALDAVKGLR